MPSFSSAVSNLEMVGPVVDMKLGVTNAAEQAMKAAGNSVPSTVDIAVMIDTGASGSVVQAGLAQQLGLQPVSAEPINTPSSQNVLCDVYAVQFIFPSNIMAETTAVEAPLAGQNIQALIGRDILKFGVLVYLGRENQFTLAF